MEIENPKIVSKNPLTPAEKKFVEEHELNEFYQPDLICVNCSGTGLWEPYIFDQGTTKLDYVQEYWKKFDKYKLCKYCFGVGIPPIPMCELDI